MLLTKLEIVELPSVTIFSRCSFHVYLECR